MPEWRRDIIRDETHVGGVPAGSGRLRVALMFPGEYAVGMGNLAVHGLFGMLNRHPDVLCERVFYPGLRERGRQRDGTLRSLDHGTALGAFDVIAISSSYELDWLNVPLALQSGGVPPLADDRAVQAPLVIAGGPAVTANPVPLSGLADALFVGEVEPVLDDLLDAMLDTNMRSRSGRQRLLERLASLPGLYVSAVREHATVERVVLDDLDAVPSHTRVLSPHTEFPSTFLIETGRGCPRTCRFCLARRIYHPVRMRGTPSILDSARLGLQFTQRIGLLGAAVADHPHIEEIAAAILQMGGGVSTSSLRAEAVTPELLACLAASGQRQITLAPETADEALAEVIGKPGAREAAREAIALAHDAGIDEVKLYFMLGIPGETDEAALTIVDFVEGLERTFERLRVTVSAGALVPKPHTELARAAVPDPDTVSRRLKLLRRELRSRTNAQVRVSSARWAALQTVLGRGGRELIPVLMQASGGGPGDFERALRAEGLSMQRYLGEQTGPMPWEIVGDCQRLGVSA